MRAGRWMLLGLLVAGPAAALAGHGGLPVVYTQPMSLATSTPTEAQFLAGAGGAPATVGGELRMPVAPGRVPAVLLVHGETGVSPNVRQWPTRSTASVSA
jgi:hypothetical protein